MTTRMKRILKGLSVFVFMFIVLLLFVACNSESLEDLEARELENYKKVRSNELINQAQRMGKSNYSPENWQEILSILEEGLSKIKEATDKETVDSLHYEYFISIAHVEAYPKDKPIQPMSGAEEYAGGSGSEEDPFVITTKGQLIHFSNQVNIGENNEDYFILGADIDLESMEWNPIGLLSYYDRKPGGFSGVFDGNGHEIRNLHISERKINSAAENIGLFGKNEGTIKNLGVIGMDIEIIWGPVYGVSMNAYVGGLVGNNFGDILNCYISGNIFLKYVGYPTEVSPNSICTGGLVGGHGEGNVRNCYSTVNMDIEYGQEHGGVVAAGLVASGTVDDCFLVGNITLNYDGYESRHCKFYLFADEYTNCHAYEGTSFHGFFRGLPELVPKDNSCSRDDLNVASFYTKKLGWDESIWDFDNLDFDEGLLPKLRKIKYVPSK